MYSTHKINYCYYKWRPLTTEKTETSRKTQNENICDNSKSFSVLRCITKRKPPLSEYADFFHPMIGRFWLRQMQKVQNNWIAQDRHAEGSFGNTRLFKNCALIFANQCWMSELLLKFIKLFFGFLVCFCVRHSRFSGNKKKHISTPESFCWNSSIYDSFKPKRTKSFPPKVFSSIFPLGSDSTDCYLKSTYQKNHSFSFFASELW